MEVDPITGDRVAINCFSGSVAPPNDDCADSVMGTEGTFPFDTTGATTDGPALDPMNCDTGPFGDEMVHNDVWGCYTASCTGTVTILIPVALRSTPALPSTTAVRALLTPPP